jgi:hypothetical protein
MIKGLYFKLNMEKARDKIIYNFFNSLTEPDNKIDAMYILINNYLSKGEVDELATMCIDNNGGSAHGQRKENC